MLKQYWYVVTCDQPSPGGRSWSVKLGQSNLVIKEKCMRNVPVSAAIHRQNAQALESRRRRRRSLSDGMQWIGFGCSGRQRLSDVPCFFFLVR